MTKSRAPDQEKSGTDHFEKSPILLPSPLHWSGRISNEIDFNYLRKKSIYQEIDFKSNETTRISNEIRFQFQFLSRERGARCEDFLVE